MRIIDFSIIVVILSGCATAPDVNLGYNLPKTTITTTVKQVITCKPDNLKKPTMYSFDRVSTVEFSSKYEADSSHTYYINPSKLGSWFTDSDFTLNYNEGGTINSIDTKVTGKGEAVISLVNEALSFLKGFSSPLTNKATQEFLACDTVYKKIKGKLKQITVLHKYDYSDSKPIIKLGVASNGFQSLVTSSLFTYNEIKALTDEPFITIKGKSQPTPMHVYKSECKNKGGKYDSNCLANHAEIAVRQPKPYSFAVTVENITKTQEFGLPQYGQLYTLPLPTGTLFGTNDAKIEFNGDGSVKTITYNTTPGSDGVGKILEKLKGDSDVEKAKTQADTIYQQNRLKLCEDNPEECTAK